MCAVVLAGCGGKAAKPVEPVTPEATPTAAVEMTPSPIREEMAEVTPSPIREAMPEVTPSPIREATPEVTPEVPLRPISSLTSEATPTVAPTVAPTATPTVAPTVAPTATPTVAPTAAPTATSTAAPTATPVVHETAPGTNIVHKVSEAAPWIVIDAGHQSRADSEREPVGPGATETKAKVSSGTQGKWTGVSEYALNLEISLRLRDVLLSEGYNVIMIRETNEVNISNAERAAIANEAQADVFIRIHADGSDNPSAQGMMTICPTPKNVYCKEIHEESRRLSDCVLRQMVAKTGAKSRKVWETDTMSGINWCQVPVTIVEMGFMSNKEEDYLLQDAQYQEKIVQGILEGIQEYLGR